MSGKPEVSESDDGSLVQLRHVEVAPNLLTTPGDCDLTDIIARHQPLQEHWSAYIGALPQTGWRTIMRGADELGKTTVFAAPLGRDFESWALIYLYWGERDSRWIFSADPGPVFWRPSRVTRRQGLGLSWDEDPIATQAGMLPELTISLRNGADQPWIADTEDGDHVRGWLLDASGHRLSAPSWFGYADGSSVPSLQPGEAVLLPVTLATEKVENLPPGYYAIEANLIALDLDSDRGSLQISR